MKTEAEITEMCKKFEHEKDNPKWSKPTREMAQICYGILTWVLNPSDNSQRKK